MCPCIDCEERHLACHDTCVRYKDWKDVIDQKSKARADYLQKKYERPVQTKTRGRTLSHKK